MQKKMVIVQYIMTIIISWSPCIRLTKDFLELVLFGFLDWTYLASLLFPSLPVFVWRLVIVCRSLMCFIICAQLSPRRSSSPPGLESVLFIPVFVPATFPIVLHVCVQKSYLDFGCLHY